MKKLDNTHVGIANINFLCNYLGLWLSSVARKADGTELSATGRPRIGYLDFFGSKFLALFWFHFLSSFFSSILPKTFVRNEIFLIESCQG